MKPEEKVEFQKTLDRLEKVIAEKVPVVHRRLAPPANEETIKKLRAALGGAEIEVIETLFKWHDGSTERVGCELLPMGQFDGTMLTFIELKQPRDFFPKKLRQSITLFHDHAGDGYKIDFVSNPPRVFYSFLETSEIQDLGTVPEFFDFVMKYWEETDVKLEAEDELFLEWTDDFFEMRRKYAESFNQK